LLAEATFNSGEKEAAIALLQEGVKLDPTQPLNQRSLGSVLERSGKPRAAAAAYREYARLAPNAADAADLLNRAAGLEKQASRPSS
jgi:predicted Zn-dependent protease